MQAALDSDDMHNLVETLFQEVPGIFNRSPCVHEAQWIEKRLLKILDQVGL